MKSHRQIIKLKEKWFTIIKLIKRYKVLFCFMFARFYHAFFLFLLIWNIFECHYGDACNQSIINAIRRSVNTRKNRSLYFLQIIWIEVLFFVHSHCFWQNIVVFTKMRIFFLLLSLFMCIVWNAFFNVCLLVNSLIRCLKFFSFLWSILALSLSGAFFSTFSLTCEFEREKTIFKQ